MAAENLFLWLFTVELLDGFAGEVAIRSKCPQEGEQGARSTRNSIDGLVGGNGKEAEQSEHGQWAAVKIPAAALVVCGMVRELVLGESDQVLKVVFIAHVHRMRVATPNMFLSGGVVAISGSRRFIWVLLRKGVMGVRLTPEGNGPSTKLKRPLHRHRSAARLVARRQHRVELVGDLRARLVEGEVGVEEKGVTRAMRGDDHEILRIVVRARSSLVLPAAWNLSRTPFLSAHFPASLSSQLRPPARLGKAELRFPALVESWGKEGMVASLLQFMQN